MSNYSVNSISAVQNLQTELAEVQQQLAHAVDELYPPLRELVRSRLKLATPPLRAAIVLTAGIGDPDSEELREKRILLAAALEMLYIALHIHHLLLTNTPVNGDNAVDKSLLGSIILAGDYCFSRSAILAARTNNPAVVILFSNALKVVSEGKLRQYFTKDNLSFNENQNLFEAGARAAATLANLPQAMGEAFAALGASLAIATPIAEAIPNQFMPQLPQTLAPAQQARWRALLEWFAAA